MFYLVQITPELGDCTCGYEVKLNKEYTVKEFCKGGISKTL